jgi:hypothetical protein
MILEEKMMPQITDERGKGGDNLQRAAVLLLPLHFSTRRLQYSAILVVSYRSTSLFKKFNPPPLLLRFAVARGV